MSPYGQDCAWLDDEDDTMTRGDGMSTTDHDVYEAPADFWGTAPEGFERACESREESPAWWKPWTPKVGDRVRVRVNMECSYCLDPHFPKCYDMALSDDGRTGTVYDVGHDRCSCRWEDEEDGPSEDHLGHDVWIKWDERRSYDEPVLEGIPFDAHFAASELEPLGPSLRAATDGLEEGA